jgi:capsule polysaccharide export protein KpsE/RkpR
MTFGERMKELLDQGAQAAAKAGEKAQDWGEKGYQASKEWLNKAGAKAQELGEIGMLKLEIRQLETQAQKLLSRLGAETYQAFAEQGASTLSPESPTVKPLLAEIARIREEILRRETELKNRN